MGSVWPTVRTLRRMSGRTERTVENIRPMNRSGRSLTTAATRSTRGARLGANGASTVETMPWRCLPGRGAHAVAIDQPEGVPRVVVGELDGDRAAHGVAEHHDRAGLHLAAGRP